MCILTKKEISEAIQKNELVFTPALDAYQVQPTSIDLRLGWSFYIPFTWKYGDSGRSAVIADNTNFQRVEETTQLIKLKPGQYFELLPGESVIASSLEKIEINTGRFNGTLYPRSSSSRRGLGIDSGTVDPFYSGNLIIPMRNNSHQILRIFPGERICQIIFNELKTELTKDEAVKHGVGEAKYNTATPYNLGLKVDPKDELELLKTGKLDELKDKFKII